MIATFLCALHEAARPQQSSEPARVILSGMSLCRKCARTVTRDLGDGVSIYDILRRASSGVLP